MKMLNEVVNQKAQGSLETSFLTGSFRVFSTPGSSFVHADTLVQSALTDIEDGVYSSAVPKLLGAAAEVRHQRAEIAASDPDLASLVQENIRTLEKWVKVLSDLVERGEGKDPSFETLSPYEPDIRRRRLDIPSASHYGNIARETWETVQAIFDYYLKEASHGHSSVVQRYTANGTYFYLSDSRTLGFLAQCLSQYSIEDFLSLGSANGLDSFVLSLFTSRVRGVELDPYLFRESLQHQQKLSTLPGLDTSKIDLERANFFNVSWKGYGLIYIYWPFPKSKTKEMAEAFSLKLAEELSPGALFMIRADWPVEITGMEEVPLNSLVESRAGIPEHLKAYCR